MPARLRRLALALCLAVPALAMAPTGLSGPPAGPEEASTDSCDEPCPGDTQSGDCSPGCDECACCPGALQAFVQAAIMPQESPPVRVISISAPNTLAPGIRSRVFRPPRPAPAV